MPFTLKADCLEIELFGMQSALLSEALDALSTVLEKPGEDFYVFMFSDWVW